MAKFKLNALILFALSLQACSTINITWDHCKFQEALPDGRDRYRCEKTVGDDCYKVDVFTKDGQVVETIPYRDPCAQELSTHRER